MPQRPRTGVRGYLPRENIGLEGVDFVMRRRGPRRGTVGEDHRQKMMAYAAEQRIMATYPEAIVHFELTERRYEDQVHFDFQSSMMGGRMQLGGAVVDFLWLDRPQAWRVQGTYWHKPFDRMGHGTGDQEQKMMLEGMGYEVYDLWEPDILDPDWLEDFLRRHVDQQILRTGWRQ